MKRRDLLASIATAARGAGIEWEMVHVSGRGDHEKWRLGHTVQVAIPRHREVNELTARSILQATESELGKGWWR